ncbi:hypothetical protein BH09BAC4_BH09BAC4_15860 [soil metagenome]
MPIRQPKQRTIYASEFLDKGYSFTIESTLEPQERTGLLILSASSGYLLTTSFNKEPKREQIIEHRQQADGSWLATGQVTVITTDESPATGTIVIRNPLAETMVLPIEATSEVMGLANRSILTVSESALTFSQTAPDKPSFRILTITQQANGVPSPVTLTTDAPDHFQLACDSRPTFSPTLTLTPSSQATYVHVRYAASTSGLKRGQLTISSAYEERTIALEGQSAGFLPGIRALSPAALRPLVRPSVPKRLPLVVALIMSIGLVYAGYSNRCQLFPALCNDKAISPIRTPEKLPSSTLANVTEASEKAVLIPTELVESPKTEEVVLPEQKTANRPFLSSLAKPARLDRKTKTDAEKEDAYRSKPKVREKPTDQNAVNKLDNRPSRQTPSVSAAEESELERVLNQKQ